MSLGSSKAMLSRASNIRLTDFIESNMSGLIDPILKADLEGRGETSLLRTMASRSMEFGKLPVSKRLFMLFSVFLVFSMGRLSPLAIEGNVDAASKDLTELFGEEATLKSDGRASSN